MANKSILKTIQFIAIVIALLSLESFAGPTLQNGDFSAGLSNWTVEYGTVTDGGGFALFEEDPSSLSSTLSQQFTIPSLALELSFDVAMSSVPGGDYDPFVAPDAFTASLLDPLTFDPLIYTLGYPDFYYLDNSGYLQTIATISGNTVRLDISTLRGLDALLSFDLFGGEDGMFTTVNLDNVNISIIPTPGALLLGLIGTCAVGLWRRFRNLA